jgi:hypothetical protein
MIIVEKGRIFFCRSLIICKSGHFVVIVIVGQRGGDYRVSAKGVRMKISLMVLLILLAQVPVSLRAAEVNLGPIGDVTTWPGTPYRWLDVADNSYQHLTQTKGGQKWLTNTENFQE